MRNKYRLNDRCHCKLRIEPLEPRLMLSTTTAVNSGSWSSASTWDNGVPTQFIDAVVPTGKTVQLIGSDHTAKTLLIRGTLEAAENAVTEKSLVAEWILVDGGIFRVGTAGNRYDTNRLTITLEGDNPNQDIPSLGISDNDAFLMVRSSGSLQLFGAAETSWTQLGATVEAGSGLISFKEPVTWEVGDEIVVASTTFDMNEAETRTITFVTADGKSALIDSPLVPKQA